MIDPTQIGRGVSLPAGELTVRISVLDLLRVARPGLIASHLWLFALPLAVASIRPDLSFWIGAVYASVPLGALIYGWNDFFDGDVDSLAERKQASATASFFGYRLSESQRKLLPAYVLALQIPFALLAVSAGYLWTLGWFAAMVLGNWLYNGPGPRMSRLPGLAEAVATGIYLCILWLSAVLTGWRPPPAVWAVAAAAILVFQIAGAVVDLDSDRKVGKMTFAAVVGERPASFALAAILTLKAGIFAIWLAAPEAALLSLLAVPLCLARPELRGLHWAGVVYVYSIFADWIGLAFVAARN